MNEMFRTLFDWGQTGDKMYRDCIETSMIRLLLSAEELVIL